jgi:hypothetical protein
MLVEPNCARIRRLALALLPLLVLTSTSAKDKPRPAAKYVGHVLSLMGTRFVIQIDAFPPEDIAEQVAVAGRSGNANAIREALGKLDCGFMKFGDMGYRIAFARRVPEPDGLRLFLIFRNEFKECGRASFTTLIAPPLAATEVWIPTTGLGRAVITGVAGVTFQSVDDIKIADWSEGQLESHDLRAAEN